MDSPEKRAAKWAATKGTGASSLALLAVMVGEKPDSSFSYPHDGSDLGRCIRLLEAVPEYRERLGEMAKVGKEWAGLVKHWEELEAMWHEGATEKLYNRMREILDPIEAKNRNTIKFGKGATLHFGR